MRTHHMVAALALLFAVTPALAREPRPLRLAAPISSWDEAIPLGNGLTGGLLWGEGERIHLSLDRGDLWDLRLPAMLHRPDWNYATLRKLQQAGDQNTIQTMFNEPYGAVAYPTKIPCARLVLTLPQAGAAKKFELDLQQALGRVQFGKAKLETFFSATAPVAMLRIEGATPQFEIVRPASLDKLGYAPAKRGRDASSQWLLQEGALGLQYAVVVAQQRDGDITTLAVSITSTHDGKDPLRLAQTRVRDALAHGYARELQPHQAWWRDFWATSSITLPDPSLQFHYDLVKYYYGAASRTGAPPVPLQGVWTRDSDALPPWKGDYHNDLNTQMTYLAYPTAGLFESGASFTDFNWNLLPAYRRHAREFFATRGAVVPGVMTLDGQPTGGWAQYSLSPTQGLWVGQSFYLHWRYTMDRAFLAQRAYPWLSEVAEGTLGVMHEDAQGKLKLPLSASPEIFDNSMQAWLTPNSNYDLSLLQWAFAALAEMADALDKRAEARKWRSLRDKLEPLDVDPNTGALTIVHGIPYAESHRHFSHAMALYPLGQLSIEGTPIERDTVKATLLQLDRVGAKEWTGYSYAWMSAMAARAGEAELAYRYLRDYERGFLLRNGFHVNGDQSGTGLSRMTYRPFTLEGNFQAMQAVQEMLLQSWGGVVRVFPAATAGWREVQFDDLRAEGGYKVSAKRVDGQTVAVKIEATTDGLLRLRDNFPASLQWNRPVRDAGDTLEVSLKKGETLIGS